MAIDRTPWNALVDDDGSNLVGTIWNKDKIKTVILDPTDAAILPIVYGTFAPADYSGAALTMQAGTEGHWAKYGRIVFAWLRAIYPANAVGIPAYIGGLPYPARVPVGGVHSAGIARTWYVNPANNALQPLNPTTGTAYTNTDLSGANVVIWTVYLTD